MQAIDMHVHVPREPGLPEIEIEAELLRYFRAPPPPSDPAEMAARFRDLDLFGVIFSVDTTTNTGEKPDSNDWVASIVNAHPQQFMGFASVDPWMGKAACYELERAVKELGLKGLKLHPIHQAFMPNDTRFYPLYEVADGLGIPVLFHSGFAGAGSGTPGGSGLKLKYSQPIPCFDDVAADFPNLTIIMAHPAWPWIDQQIAVALHKSNVYLDLSGWMPRFIPEPLIRETNTRLQDKVMFGSDYPFIQPDRWLHDFQSLQMRDNVIPKVLLENARRALNISVPA